MGKGKLTLKNSKMNMGGSSSSSAGGINGSGIFGMFGSTVHCDANSDSFYCSITKIVNLIGMFLFIVIVLYLLYIAYNYYFVKGKKKYY